VKHLELALQAWKGVVAATENHYVTHEVWLFGQFDWKRYLPDVEADIRIAREAKPFRADSTYDVEGLHGWLEYSYGRLGRHVASPSANTARPVRVDAGGRDVGVAGVESKPTGESITGARDFASSGASAAYRIDVPADGAYSLTVACWWPERSGSFAVLVDESNTRSYSLRLALDAPVRSWQTQKLGAPLYLGAGSHTVRLIGRTPGARVDWFELAPIAGAPEPPTE
jgi:hypothetical protein